MRCRLAILIVLLLLLCRLAERPTPRQPDLRVQHDVVYSTVGGADLKLDLALPQGGCGPYPAVLILHSGGWVSGSRQELTWLLDMLAQRGYVSAAIDYRLAPAARFPAQLEDCQAAVRWLRDHCLKYQIDPEHIGVVGFSAGAHLACLLGTSAVAGHEANRVQAVVSFSGPTDLTTRDWPPVIERYLIVPFLGGTFAEQPEVYRRASPAYQVSSDNPPFLLVHGTDDRVVPVSQTKLLAEKLQGVGVPVQIVLLPGEDHANWSWPSVRDSVGRALEFLDKQLKTQTSRHPW